MTSSRDSSIDTVRGLACVLLILYHITGPGSGMLQIGEGLWYSVNQILSYIRMPLFTILSGVVYGWRPYIPGTTNTRSYISGKARRLLLPLIFVGTPYAILLRIFSGTEFDWRFLHIDPVGYFWFVEALFIAFVATIGLEHLRVFEHLDRYFATLLAAFALFLVTFDLFPDTLALGARAVFLLPYFLVGVGLARFNVADQTLIPRWAIAAMLAIGIGVFGLAYWGQGSRWVDLHGVVFGVAVCCGLYLVKPRVPLLANIGIYSYSVYLFHGFFLSFAKSFVEISGLQSTTAYVIVGLAVATIGAIVLEKILLQIPIAATLFLGRRLERPAFRPKPIRRPIAAPLGVATGLSWPRLRSR